MPRFILLRRRQGKTSAIYAATCFQVVLHALRTHACSWHRPPGATLVHFIATPETKIILFMMITCLCSERDEDAKELPLVADDHAVADARELSRELVLTETPHHFEET